MSLAKKEKYYYGFPKEALMKVLLTAFDGHKLALSMCNGDKDVYKNLFCQANYISKIMFCEYGGIDTWLHDRIWCNAQKFCVNAKVKKGEVKIINLDKKFIKFIK